MRNDLEHLLHERLVGRNLRVPRIHEFLNNYRNKRIELKIDIVAARERGQEVCDWCSLIRTLRTKCTADKRGSRLVRELAVTEPRGSRIGVGHGW